MRRWIPVLIGLGVMAMIGLVAVVTMWTRISPPPDAPPVNAPVNHPMGPFIYLKADGGLELRGTSASHPTEVATIKSDMTAMGWDGGTVLIKADPDSSYQMFKSLMDQLNAVGITQIGLISEDLYMVQ